MSNYCDPITGICAPSTLEELMTVGQEKIQDRTEIIYVGDPMCSWCWGISPALIQLRDHFAKEKVAFNILVGGLRPGGGDPWNEGMKNFLTHHWKEVNQRSGQPFGYALMDLDEFDYDTEPACRAVVAARPLVKERELEFFEAIQRKFYVDSKDPKKQEFYTDICKEFEISTDDFFERFNDPEIKAMTMTEFQLNRQWGVRGYPTTILLHNDNLHLIANGFATFEDMKSRITPLLAEAIR